jgi:gliding motility-associated-like protein
MRNLADYGKYPVKLKVTTPAGCTAESFDTITVYAVPKASFESDPPFTTIAKPFFNFTNKTTIADGQTLKYEWNMGPDPQLPKGSPDRILVDANPQNIPFGDTISNSIPVYLKVVTQPGGCIDTAMRTVCINPDITVFIPSAFRPVQGANSAPCADPTFTSCNDVFRVYADGFATIEVYVFNRWGQQVFMTNDPNTGWRGTVNNNGADCPQDVYIYQINATSYNGKKYTYSGSITLLR